MGAVYGVERADNRPGPTSGGRTDAARVGNGGIWTRGGSPEGPGGGTEGEELESEVRAGGGALGLAPLSAETHETPSTAEAGSDPRGPLGVTWGVYLCAGKPPLADIILFHPLDLTRCDRVIGLAIPAMSGHFQYRSAAS